MTECPVPVISRRRSFWTTQPDACGTYPFCGDISTLCGIPGMQYEDVPAGRTIRTSNWVISLVLNILNTRARDNVSKCGTNVTGIGGHWSESYREDGLYNGTKIWNTLRQPVARIQDAIKLLNVQLQSDIGKLIQMGIASDVQVETVYAGSNKVVATVTISGPTIETTKVDLTTERLANEWVWRT